MKHLALIFALILAFTIAGCKQEKEKTIINQHVDVQIEIIKILNSIIDSSTAVEAVPRLRELASKSKELRQIHKQRYTDDPEYAKRFKGDDILDVLGWGQALGRFNRNKNIPQNLRIKIMKIISEESF